MNREVRSPFYTYFFKVFSCVFGQVILYAHIQYNGGVFLYDIGIAHILIDAFAGLPVIVPCLNEDVQLDSCVGPLYGLSFPDLPMLIY
jgi:hypothetical protein